VAGLWGEQPVLKWIFEHAKGRHTRWIRRLPAPRPPISIHSLDVPIRTNELLSVDCDGWLAEVPLIREHFDPFGTQCPRA